MEPQLFTLQLTSKLRKRPRRRAVTRETNFSIQATSSNVDWKGRNDALEHRRTRVVELRTNLEIWVLFRAETSLRRRRDRCKDANLTSVRAPLYFGL